MLVTTIPLTLLITICQAPHSAHDAEDIIICGIDTDLSSGCALHCGVGENELKGGIVNAREVACAGRLVLLRPEGERVHVDAGVGCASVGEEGLNKVKVGSLALREAILAVELELGGDDGVLAPTVEGKSGLGEDEGACIGDERLLGGTGGSTKVVLVGVAGGDAGEGCVSGVAPVIFGVVDGGDEAGSGGRCVVGEVNVSTAIKSSSVGEEAVGVDEVVVGIAAGTARAGNRVGATEGMDGVGEGIYGIGVVEGLGAEDVEEGALAVKGGAVVYVGVRLHDPDELLDGVVEVKLDLVGRRADRLVTSELKLLNEVLVGVLGHAAALVGVKEHVVHEERSGNERLVVGVGALDCAGGGGGEGVDGPEALVNGAKINVDADLVVLESNEGESEPGVLAEPELEGNVEGGLGEGVTRSANLAGSVGLARTVHRRERGVSQVGELGGVADHGPVTLLLGSVDGELVPDVHPVAVVAINALAANLYLNLGDELLTGEVKPPSIDTLVGRAGKLLANLGKCYLENGGVGKISVTGDGAGDTPSEISLAIEGLLNGLHGEVGVAPVGDLPVGNLRITSKINILCAVGY